ncbi:thioesterase family protein [Sneathiella sp. HT1-7]|jgi:acyl-CoA thioester hydrolase|uniref:thioesterase family protein n=1 Tax=Sneathiella sp. HT1-7 TaxID=2887192 RepID=UPI001D143C47|nr:thioesterase family protein [Sneathiella sp. HT1-7]MCC3306501.1 thioesterase family protein [Sneathiella sp. HT1-7]
MNETSMPLIHEQTVRPEWIDHNKHMNVAYYVLIFDHALDDFLDEIELTREYRQSANCTVYVLETHVTYIQEVHEGDALNMYVRVLDCDEKRMHLFLEMRHRDKGFLAATSEQMIMHLSTKDGPKAAPMPENLQTNLQKHKDQFAGDPLPKQAGAVIGIRRKS